MRQFESVPCGYAQNDSKGHDRPVTAGIVEHDGQKHCFNNLYIKRIYVSYSGHC